MRRENEALEKYKSLHENRVRLAQKEIEKINEAAAARDNFRHNYHVIKDMKARKDAERSKLMEAARNDALSTVIKAIYITAMEAETMMDENIILAENMVDKWIDEQGGASKILSKTGNNTYLLSRISQIVEDAAEKEVDEIQKDETAEDKEVPDENASKAVQIAQLTAKDAEIKAQIANLKAEKKAEDEESAENDSESDNSEAVPDTDDKADGIESTEDSSDSDEKKSEEDDNAEPEEKIDDLDMDSDENAEKSDDSDKEDKSEEKDDNVDDKKEPADTATDESDGDESTDTSTEDDNKSESDKEDNDEDDDIDLDADIELKGEEEDDKQLQKDEEELVDDEVDPDEDASEDDDINDAIGDPISDEEDEDVDTTVDGDTDNDGKIFDELEDEEDVQKAIEIIRSRVADAEETFIKNNAEDKKKIDELLDKISTNVKTVEDLNKKDPKKAQVAQEAVREYKRKIDSIYNEQSSTIFAKMSRILTQNILKNNVVKESYTTEDGKLDVDLVMESAKVMYGFLETLNTLQIEKVDEKYIANVINGMRE